MLICGGEGWLGFPDLWSGQKHWWNWYFNPCGEFWWSLEGPVSQIHSPHLHAGAPGIFSDFLRSVQMLKRERCVESNGKLPNLFIPSKIATLVPEFVVEDLPLGRTAALVHKFAVKDLPLGRTLWWWWGGSRSGEEEEEDEEMFHTPHLYHFTTNR